MKFLNIKDIQVELKDYFSDQMLDEDYSYLDDIESAAIEKVKAYTNHIINIDYELSRTGSERNSDLKRTIVILVAYDAEARLTTKDIRENTLRRYNDIIKYLSDIQNKNIIPTWLLKDRDADNTVTKSIFDSNVPQNIICY